MASDFKLIPTLVFSSNRSFRGAIIWPSPILGVFPGFSYKNIVQTGPGGLTFELYSMDELKFYAAVGYFDDNKPSGPLMRFGKHKSDHRNTRDGTIETTLGFNYKRPRSVNFTFHYIQNYLKKNHQFAHYLQANISHPTLVIPFTSLGLGMDYHEKRSAQYSYGPSALRGLGHIEGKISIFLPFLPKGGVLIADYTYSKITNHKNKNAYFVQGQFEFSKISLVSIWSIDM